MAVRAVVLGVGETLVDETDKEGGRPAAETAYIADRVALPEVLAGV